MKSIGTVQEVLVLVGGRQDNFAGVVVVFGDERQTFFLSEQDEPLCLPSGPLPHPENHRATDTVYISSQHDGDHSSSSYFKCE